MNRELEEPTRLVLKAQVKKLQQASRLMQRHVPPPDMSTQVLSLLQEVTDELNRLVGQTWPEPTTEAPELATLVQWLWEDHGCEATDVAPRTGMAN